jgi:hypothetical protein
VRLGCPEVKIGGEHREGEREREREEKQKEKKWISVSKDESQSKAGRQAFTCYSLFSSVSKEDLCDEDHVATSPT